MGRHSHPSLSRILGAVDHISIFRVADNVVSNIGVPSWSGAGVQNNLSLYCRESLVVTLPGLGLKRGFVIEYPHGWCGIRYQLRSIFSILVGNFGIDCLLGLGLKLTSRRERQPERRLPGTVHQETRDSAARRQALKFHDVSNVPMRKGKYLVWRTLSSKRAWQSEIARTS